MRLLFISKMAALAPAITDTFQPEGRTMMGVGLWVEREKGGHEAAHKECDL